MGNGSVEPAEDGQFNGVQYSRATWYIVPTAILVYIYIYILILLVGSVCCMKRPAPAYDSSRYILILIELFVSHKCLDTLYDI